MIRTILGGAGIGARLIRSSAWISLSYGVSQLIRLVSNLILTRLLFPEAFGLMALITVFLVGLIMLSDIGISPSIQQSAHGDDPDFVDTAWTIQIIRGVILWLTCCALGVFAAWFYGDARLQTMLPVAGLSLLIAGFDPTRIETASRHLNLGRVTQLDLLAQVIGLIGMLLLVWALRSIWALVIGGVFQTLIRLVIMHIFMPGPNNRLRWAPNAVSELINFGKWIFLSTLCGFLLTQGDKAILGKYFSLEMLGIYNIGYFLASFPQALASKIMAQVMIPLHREHPPGASSENYAKVRQMRYVMTCVVFTMQFTMAFAGIWIVGLLYDERFYMAGSFVIAVACMNVPYLIGMTYDYSALSSGDSRGLFHLLLAKATAQILLFLLGIELYGITGALMGVWLSQILIHPLAARLAYKHGAWDLWHDFTYATVGALLTSAVLWIHWDVLKTLGLFVSFQ